MITSCGGTAHIPVVRGQVWRLVARSSYTSVTRKLQKYKIKELLILTIQKLYKVTITKSEKKILQPKEALRLSNFIELICLSR